MARFFGSVGLAFLGLITLGCQCLNRPPAAPTPFVPAAPLPACPAPVEAQPVLGAPGGPAFAAPAGPSAPTPIAPSAPPPVMPSPPSASNYAPGAGWRAPLGEPSTVPPGSVRLMPPEAITSESRNSGSYQTTEPALVNPPVTAWPAGIRQFNIVKAGVATGLRPSLDDGLDWLQAKAYRTVLYIRMPGADDSADRKQVEKRGMKYLSLELSPESLSESTAAELKSIVRDRSNYPLFVYDADGSLWSLVQKYLNRP